MKQNIITVVLVLTAFALGWTSNGYVIYKGIVGNVAGSVDVGK